MNLADADARSKNIKYYLQHPDEFKGEGGHERILQKLKELNCNSSKKDFISIDVGANVGNKINAIRQLQTEKILAFEPNPLNVKILREKFQNDADIEIYDCAVSNVHGVLPFYIYRTQKQNRPGNTLGGLRAGGKLIAKVPVVTLDSILAASSYDQKKIKYIKIDTEGNDTNVIYGLEQNLHRVQYILFEASDCLDDGRGPGHSEPLKKCVDFLDTHGFDTYRIGSRKMFRINGPLWDPTYEKVKFWSNCFAIKRNDETIQQIIS